MKMLKAKATIEIEIDQDKIPKNWQQDLESTIANLLDGIMVRFGSESRAVMKIKNIKIEESN